MKIQLRPSLLKVRRTGVKFIILHHTAEMYPNPEVQIDNSNYQLPGILKSVPEKKDADVNYNIIIERIKEDYIPIICRPLSFLCKWPDIEENINNRSIHVALLGNYDFKIPEPRCYEILAFRVLNPLLKTFHLNVKRVVLHREISKEKISCPGEFVDKTIVESMVKRFVIK